MKLIPNDPESGECAGVEFAGLGLTLGGLPFLDRSGERRIGQAIVGTGVEARFREQTLGSAKRLDL
jgi:hypothetical protein